MSSDMNMIQWEKGDGLTKQLNLKIPSIFSWSFCCRNCTVQDRSSKHLSMHIGNRFKSRPLECINYKPEAKNSPREKKGVI